jgi:hypothetical protein
VFDVPSSPSDEAWERAKYFPFLRVDKVLEYIVSIAQEWRKKGKGQEWEWHKNRAQKSEEA